ncbi:hypothetical protein FRC15_007895 [Serendipita sp. 397]|nr:hypothetical protein FRC15_007895 [Serendipita sp. 397]
MCGIIFRIGLKDEFFDEKEWEELTRLNAQRGPNSQKEISLEIGNLSLRFFSSVLHLRGDHVAVQPHTDDQNILCWNGEVFEGLPVSAVENDGRGRTCLHHSMKIRPDRAIQHRKRKIYFGRDPLGRRSLVIRPGIEDRQYLTLASVSNGEKGYEEVPADKIFSISLSDEDYQIQPVSRTTISNHGSFAVPKPLRRDLPSLDYLPPTDPLSPIWEETVTKYIAHLEESVSLRTRDIPRHVSQGTNTARVSVMFSGGIDSSVVAFLAHRHIPLSEPIDLLNVAFENPRALEADIHPSKTKKPKRQSEDAHEDEKEAKKYSVPDRLTGLTQLEEFRRLAPERVWNFVEIDVPYEESTRYRSTIEQLMAPARTIMDLSLAQALYFASRGIGFIRKDSGEMISYTSTARVILSGLGADELLGGYIRHRNVYKHAGWQGLLDELQLDVDRINTRNLGRDDRVISSHGKEARYPFLSMNLLAYLSSLPIYLKVDPRVVAVEQQDDISSDAGANGTSDKGTSTVVHGLPGDKLLHRLAARRLGLEGAAKRAKRAMQFGTRSACMEGTKGTKKIKGVELLGGGPEV